MTFMPQSRAAEENYNKAIFEWNCSDCANETDNDSDNNNISVVNMIIIDRREYSNACTFNRISLDKFALRFSSVL